ncbi:MAG: ABC transporter permease, partial [Acidobacteria bacterium]|nr:ABC transporter permease [Acidobacteriota bacterium]
MALFSSYLPELYMGLSSLLVHKLRSLLTMLGMIFGVGAVVAMLSITAGAQKEMMSYIDLLGVNNIIIEAKEAVDRNELQARRAISPGLSFRDFRAVAENVPGIEALTPRKRFKPLKVLPKTAQEAPLLIGVQPNYIQINSLKAVEGRFFNEEDDARSAPVCVLGESAKVNLLGYDNAVGKYVKINDTWLQVIGVLAQQASADTEVEGLEVINRNNLVIAPLNTVMRRFEDNNSYLKDEIDGIYIRVTPQSDSIETAGVVSAILTATHKDAGDFTVTVPAGLLEQRKRTQFIFSVVMICIAGTSLLVGGIGIMNIMLATVLERTREIGIRRAIGARQADIVRQ